MVRKVMCGYEFKRAAGVVTRKLARWMADAGYVGRSEAKREVSVALAQAPGPHREPEQGQYKSCGQTGQNGLAGI
jgi:hypothetical protein